jgi:hypothetical protein
MTTQTETFVEYILDFYGVGGIYDFGATRDDVLLALGMRLQSATPEFPFDGDSIDRELVRDFMLANRP